MKELTEQDVLAIAGGLPPGVVLDEAFYATPAEPLHDPVAFADPATGPRSPSTD